MRLLALLLFSTSAFAQWTPNVKPETDVFVEVDIRLKGPPTTANPTVYPTVRLIQGVRFQHNILAQRYLHDIPCWRDTGLCPRVVGATFQVYLNTGGVRIPITVMFPQCGYSTECSPPLFPMIQAHAGQSYRLHYSRAKGEWVSPPSIITTVKP